MKIAVSGKGGVGKTLVSGVLACFFAGNGLKTIAIDADPSPNLAMTLGIPAEKAREIQPISENKDLVEAKTRTEFSGVYRLTFTVDDIVKDFSVETPCNVHLIVMGTVRSAGSGCTCPANSVIRALLRHLIVERNEVVLVDMEAGVEHLGRGTSEHVDVLLIVADSSVKSLETARHIQKLAEGTGIKRIFLVGNRVANNQQKASIQKFATNNGLKLIGQIPFDEQVVNAEMKGETPLKHKESLAVQAIEKLGKEMYDDTKQLE